MTRALEALRAGDWQEAALLFCGTMSLVASVAGIVLIVG